jgi:hypothetical protein
VASLLELLLTGRTDAFIVDQAKYPRSWADQRYFRAGSNVLRVEPRAALPTANHRVLVTRDIAGRGLTFWRNESYVVRVKWMW